MSINLSNSEQYSVGQTVIESNPVAAAVNPQIDFTNGVLAWTIQSGNILVNTFTSGNRSSAVTVIVNIPNGTWTAGNLNGNLSPAAQTTLRTLFLNIRNGLENFAINNNIISGTPAPWTTVGGV